MSDSHLYKNSQSFNNLRGGFNSLNHKVIENFGKRRKTSCESKTSTSDISDSIGNCNFSQLNLNDSELKHQIPVNKQEKNNNLIKEIINSKDKFAIFEDLLKFKQEAQNIYEPKKILPSSYNNMHYFFPYGIPVTNFTNLEQFLPTRSKSFYKKSGLIGTLTPEERKTKVDKFIAKRRQFNSQKTIKYQSRKDLADKRVRDHGRFVKNTTPRLRFDQLYDKQFLKQMDKEASKIKIIENSSWPGPQTENHLPE